MAGLREGVDTGKAEADMREVDGQMIVKRVHGGERIPRGYGVAYTHFYNDMAYCYPIPLNWVIGYTRTAILVLKSGPSKSRLEKKLRQKLCENKDAYIAQGIEIGERRERYGGSHIAKREAAYREGFEKGKQACLDFMLKELDKEVENA